MLSFAVGKVYDLKLEALRPETSLMMYCSDKRKLTTGPDLFPRTLYRQMYHGFNTRTVSVSQGVKFPKLRLTFILSIKYIILLQLATRTE